MRSQLPRSRALVALLVTAVIAASVGAIGLVASSAAAPSPVRLHLGTDGRYFKYGTTVQNLTTGSGSCVVNSPSPVMALTGSTKTSGGWVGASPGMSSDGIGVKGSSSSNGTPCAQVDPAETLTLKPGSSMSGRTFSGVRLDLELTGDAVAKLTLAKGSTSAVYLLQTGRSITTDQKNEVGYDKSAPYEVTSGPGDTTDGCAAPNSSGPNSSMNDNCLWTVNPGFAFDTITLTTVSCGTVALEGSNDFGSNPAYDTLFYPSNTAPKANADSYTTAEDTALTGNVLGNDTDAEGNPLSASKVSGPAHGTLTLAANGAFTYTPAGNYFGPDAFTYSASDGDLSSNAAVSITVTSVNDPPVAVSSVTSTQEDQSVTVTVATDIDSTVIHVSCTGAQGGTVTDNNNGSITFTPAANFNGPVNLSCTATDDGGASTATSATINVTVTPVNDPPVANNDSGEVNENANVTLNVVGNDTDVDGDTLTPTGITAVSPANSQVVVNANRTVTYTPPANYSGPASFQYRANDGTASSNLATVSITVYPVLCSNETVSDSDAAVSGSFTRLTDSFECKRYALEANATDDTVLFQPTGSATVNYRGFVQFAADPPPDPDSGGYPLMLRYDPSGGDTFHPVPWCVGPAFDGGGNVTSATIPAGETWCIASAQVTPNGVGDLTTLWQVYGQDDPKFTR